MRLTKDGPIAVLDAMTVTGAPVKRVVTTRSTSLAPRVVILGGGFAGVSTAHELARRCAGVLPVHITLISDQNFYLFTPLLAEASGPSCCTIIVSGPVCVPQLTASSNCLVECGSHSSSPKKNSRYPPQSCRQ